VTVHRPAAEHVHGGVTHQQHAAGAVAFGLLGRIVLAGRELHEDIPVFPGRFFKQTLVSTAHHANRSEPVGENDGNWVTEQVSATMQLGTHLDALSHLQIGDRGYNGWTVADLAGTSGVKRLGVETVPQVVTRGWLVDASDAGHVIDEVGDIDPRPGDAVLFHTGWGRHWNDPDRYLSAEPGPGIEVAEWLAARGVALTGCDTWSYGPVPPEDPARPFQVPKTLNVEHGVFIVENLDTSALAAAGVREFCLVLTHPKLRGATGAWTSPIALV
jgi:kynurenine formamidase